VLGKSHDLVIVRVGHTVVLWRILQSI